MKNFEKGFVNLNPITKLLSIVVFGVITILSPSFVIGAIIFVFLCILSIVIGIYKNFFKITFSFGIPMAIMLLFIQGFYSPKNKTTILDLGFAQLGLEGSLFAMKLVFTLLVFMGTFLLMNETTKTSTLVSALSKTRINKKISYIILASFNVVPQMNNKMKTIKEAQESRGLSTNGNLFKRFKSFIPLIGPVVLSSFTDAQERGMTLEIRGFGIKGVKQTSIIEVSMSFFDYTIVFILIVLLIISVIYKINS